jgi:hypothetical protein
VAFIVGARRRVHPICITSVDSTCEKELVRLGQSSTIIAVLIHTGAIMKILEAQSATLTNYEVYQHLIDQRTKYAHVKGRRPGNLETVVKEASPNLAAMFASVLIIDIYSYWTTSTKLLLH